MQKITIFTASVLDNRYFDMIVHKSCIASWRYLKQAIEAMGYECEIKLFDFDSPEVLDFKEQYKTMLTGANNRPARLANLFRLYMLSIHNNWLWLDGDNLIDSIMTADCRIDFSKSYINENWSIMYNHDTCDIFCALLEHYISFGADFKEVVDHEAYAGFIAKYNIGSSLVTSNRKQFKHLHHLAWFDSHIRSAPIDWLVTGTTIVQIRDKTGQPRHKPVDLIEVPELLELAKREFELGGSLFGKY